MIRSSGRHWRENEKRLLIGIASIIVLLVLWEAFARFAWVDPKFSSQPTRVAVAAADLLNDREFWRHAWVSFSEFLVGLIAACLVGIPLGIAMGWSRRLRMLLEPTVMVFYSVPRTTFLPLIILWFGIGLEAYAFLVFLGAVFPIIVNCVAGIQQVNPSLIRAALAFGANRWGIFRFVLLPASLPFVMGGIRLGIGRGLIGIILGEMYFSIAGLGHIIMRYQAGLNTDKLMFLVFFIAMGGVLMIALARRLEEYLGPWRRVREAD